jgi:hypothetical protein
MLRAMIGWALGACPVVTIGVRAADAGMIEFEDRSAWEAAIGDYTTVDFTGFDAGTVITTQCSDLGITFTDGFYLIQASGLAYPNDGWGLDGNGNVTVRFEEPQSWFAAEFPGLLRFWLYREDELVYTTTTLPTGAIDNFLGVVFPETFDRIYLDGFGPAHMDDLLFGAPVPGPAALPVLVFAIVRERRRRAG